MSILYIINVARLAVPSPPSTAIQHYLLYAIITRGKTSCSMPRPHQSTAHLSCHIGFFFRIQYPVPCWFSVLAVSPSVSDSQCLTWLIPSSFCEQIPSATTCLPLQVNNNKLSPPLLPNSLSLRGKSPKRNRTYRNPSLDDQPVHAVKLPNG
jgi:hypothetical protein